MAESRSKLVGYLAVAVVALLLAWRVLGWGSETGTASVAVDSGPSSAQTAPAHARARVWIHVAGAVKHPGLVRVRADARVGQAVDAAGGLTRRADLTAINLAGTIKDGQQVIVPVRGKSIVAPAPTVGGAPAPSSAPPAAGAKISLATATVEQLDGLDGIGPALAQRIIAWRDAHGGFRSVDQLGEVEGIGDKRLQALKAAVVP